LETARSTKSDVSAKNGGKRKAAKFNEMNPEFWRIFGEGNSQKVNQDLCIQSYHAEGAMS